MTMGFLRRNTWKKFILKIINNEIFSIIYLWLVSIYQFIPCASIWFGIMSLPLIFYFLMFLNNPVILKVDFEFFFFYGHPWSIIAIFGAIFFFYSFIFQLIHRKQLIQKGPYKIVRHPQYLGIIILTFGLTMISLNTSPIIPFTDEFGSYKDFVVLIFLFEVLAYVLLAKIEELWLKYKYGEKYLDYKKKVGFLFPQSNQLRRIFRKKDNKL